MLTHLGVAFSIGVVVTLFVVSRHQSEREAVEPIVTFTQMPMVSSEPTFQPIEPKLLEEKLSSLPPVMASAVSEPPPSVDVVSPPIEIVAQPIAYKEKDRILLLHKNDKVVERYINFTPDVIDAAIRCQPLQVRELLNRGASVNSSDERGDTVLAWAVKRNCTPVVQLLLESGARVNTVSRNGFTPYVWSRIYGRDEMSEILKSAGADTESGSYWWRNEEDGSNAWMKARYDALCKNNRCD